jgi:hypothetical protein
LKTYFGFKAADMKPLVSLQKQLYRDFSATQEARQYRQAIGKHCEI